MSKAFSAIYAFMQWLMIVDPVRDNMLTGGPTAAEADAVRHHFAYWQRMAKEGVALIVGRTQTTGPETMGLAVFRAENEYEARVIAESDPAVAENVFRMRLLPYAVAILGDTDGWLTP